MATYARTEAAKALRVAFARIFTTYKQCADLHPHLPPDKLREKLSGNQNFTMDSLAKLARDLGARIRITVEPLDMEADISAIPLEGRPAEDRPPAWLLEMRTDQSPPPAAPPVPATVDLDEEIPSDLVVSFSEEEEL